MSKPRPSSPADDSDDANVPAEDVAGPDESREAVTEAPAAGKTESPAEKPADSSNDLNTEDATTDSAAESNEPKQPEVDLEGVRAATEISMSGGPQSSRAKWAFINLGIKLFKLTARFFPILLMLAGMSYSYIHFFGMPPVVDKVMSTPTMVKITSNSVVEAALNTIGIEVLTPEERQEAAEEKPKSKVGQMLQQTRDVVAASNARVNLGNAIADGDFQAIEDMVAEEEGEATAEGEEGTEDGAEKGAESDPALGAGAQAVKLPEPVSVSTYAGTDARWAEFREEADGAAAVAAMLGEQEAEPEIVREVTVYTSDVIPSPEFRAWVQRVQIGGVMLGEDPKALINRMTFRPGEMVDYNLRITFEGLAKNDTLLVFRDATNAYLTVVR